MTEGVEVVVGTRVHHLYGDHGDLIPIVDIVVHAGDRDGLRRTPVHGRERQERRRHGGFCRVRAHHRDDHVGSRLGVEDHGVGIDVVRARRFRDGRPATLDDGEPCHIVVDRGRAHGLGRHRVEERGRRRLVDRDRNVRGLTPVDDVVVDTADRDRLGKGIVAGREHEAGW